MNYNSRYNSDFYSDSNYNSFNFDYGHNFDKNNKKQGCCIRYIQEICCYPSYYNDDQDYKHEDKCEYSHNDRKCCCNQNNWCKENKKEETKDCRPQNKCCCCFNRLFRW